MHPALLLAKVVVYLARFRNRKACEGFDTATQNASAGVSQTSVPLPSHGKDQAPEHPILTPLDTSHISAPTNHENSVHTANADAGWVQDGKNTKHEQFIAGGLERNGSRSYPCVEEKNFLGGIGDASDPCFGYQSTLSQEVVPFTFQSPSAPVSCDVDSAHPSTTSTGIPDLPPGFGIRSKSCNPTTPIRNPRRGRTNTAPKKVLGSGLDSICPNLILVV